MKIRYFLNLLRNARDYVDYNSDAFIHAFFAFIFVLLIGGFVSASRQFESIVTVFIIALVTGIIALIWMLLD